MAENNQILPLRRTPETHKRLPGVPDKRPRPKISSTLQAQRLGGVFKTAFQNILDRDDIAVKDDPSALAPERALVLEIIGQPTSFIKAAEKAGLEWLAEETAILNGVNEYFNPSSLVEDGDDEEDRSSDALEGLLNYSDLDLPVDRTDGRLYLGMPTIATFEKLRDLWNGYESGGKAPEGFGDWWDLFAHLHRIRPWGAEDRVAESTRVRLRAERNQRPGERISVEVDLWYRGDAVRRAKALAEFHQSVIEVGGEILDELRIDDIRYHAALVRLPASAVDAIVALAGPLSVSDDVMSIRPQSSFRFGFDEAGPVDSTDASELLEPVSGVEIAALLDGWPVENHAVLRDRIDVISLDVGETQAPVNSRYHGTAMASLILRGDLHEVVTPIARRLKVVPVLAPDDSGYESPPQNRLVLGLIHRAVVDLKEGTGGLPPSGPNVVIINHSICDEAFGFAGTVSPWARLLDHLAWTYKVLFVVSAGNISDPLELSTYPSAAAMRAATPDHRRDAILRAIDASKAMRTMYAPAEAVNALTVAAAHQDRSQEALPANLADPFGGFAAPNLNSGLGLGFNRSVKPDLMLPGGRQVAHPSIGHTLNIHGRESPAHYGQKVASPDPWGGNLTMTRRASGTSNAAALATRTGLMIGDILDASPINADMPWHTKPTAPAVLKALIAHGASWGDVGTEMAELYRQVGAKNPGKEAVSRAIGYGSVNDSRVIARDGTRVTLLGHDTINVGRRHEWRIPLPSELSSSAEFRRIVVTLAWLTPIRSNSSNYRMIGMELVGSDGRSGIWDGASRATYQPSVRASQRGTLIHAIYEGKRAIPFLDDGNFVLNVQATSRLTYTKGFDVPYALAVTIEVADTIRTDIHQSIRRRIGLQQRNPAR